MRTILVIVAAVVIAVPLMGLAMAGDMTRTTPAPVELRNGPQHGPGPCDCGGFIDEDGDGICDNCGGCVPQGPDDDGDGIPNGQDDDYTPPKDGSGNQKGR